MVTFEKFHMNGPFKKVCGSQHLKCTVLIVKQHLVTKTKKRKKKPPP